MLFCIRHHSLLDILHSRLRIIFVLLGILYFPLVTLSYAQTYGGSYDGYNMSRSQIKFFSGSDGSYDLTVASCPTTNLPKTGQDTCYYGSWGEQDCEYEGPDAWYANPGGIDFGSPQYAGTWVNYKATRFINNTDGTVTDMATGLMWVANSTAAGRGGTYNWTAAINASENLTYATYSDWRLPNVRELQSIADWGRDTPSIDTNFFACESDWYWSSTTVMTNTDSAYCRHFQHGDTYLTDKDENWYYIRPVRLGQ